MSARKKGIFPQVHLPEEETALGWLSRQSILMEQHLSFYFRPRDESVIDAENKADTTACANAFAGLGNCWLWKGEPGKEPTDAVFSEISSFLDPNWPSIKCLAASRCIFFYLCYRDSSLRRRFDCERIPDAEWSSFGSFVFFIPALEYVEGHGQDTLACTLAWNHELATSQQALGTGMGTLKDAKLRLMDLLQHLTTSSAPCQALAPNLDRYRCPCRLYFENFVQGGYST